MDKYQKMRVLGKGSFGSAILIKRKVDGALFVVKEVSLIKMSKKERDEARHECTVLQQLQHPNIVRYIEQFENRNNLYIVMEYCDGGDLAGKVKESRGPMKESQMMYYFSQICLAMEYLHSRHILHRDIKTMNVFLMKSGAVKLGDFGISTVLRNTMGMANTVCGTPYYFSPELCRNKPYNNKSDIWALGVLLYECATGGRHPFDGNSMNQLMQRIVKGAYAPLSSQFSSEFRKMVDWCMQKDPYKRPSIKQTLALPLVRRSLEQLEENLMLATQCRVRLKDIIDFEAAMDNPNGNNSNHDGKAAAVAVAVAAGRNADADKYRIPGLSPGQAAALALAKELQKNPQPLQPLKVASPAPYQQQALSPGAGVAAVVGPKPSAATPSRHPVVVSNCKNNYSPYHQQIMKNLEKLRAQKNAQATPAVVAPPPVSAPVSPTSNLPVFSRAAAAGAGAAGSPSAPPAPSHAGWARPSSPAVSPTRAAQGAGLYDYGKYRPSEPATPAPAPAPAKAPREDPLRANMQRVDAIMAKYGHNADAQAKETIHAYMRRKQEEHLQRQRDDNARRERRNELRQKELRRVLDHQRAAVNEVPAQQQRPVSPASPTPRNVSRPQSRQANVAAGRLGANVVEARPPAERKSDPGPRDCSPSRGNGNGRPSNTPSPARSPQRSRQTPSPAPSRPPSPGRGAGGVDVSAPAHLRQKPVAAFGRDPRAVNVNNGNQIGSRARSPSAVRNPLSRPSVAGEAAPSPSARQRLQEEQRQERKRMVLAANSPRLLAAGDLAGYRPRSPASAAPRPNGKLAAPSLAAPAAAPRSPGMVEARLAAAQELRERRERLLAVAPSPADRDPAVRDRNLSDEGHHLWCAQERPAQHGSPTEMDRTALAFPVSPARSPASGRPALPKVAPAPLTLEAVGHRAAPGGPAVSPTRKPAPVGLEPLGPLTGFSKDASPPPPGAAVSPARRSAAAADRRRHASLPPVLAETPELVDIQYSVANGDGDGSASSSDPLRMLRNRMSLVTGSPTGAMPPDDVPAIYRPAPGADVASAHHKAAHLQHHANVGGDAAIYAGMQRGTSAAAVESEFFLGGAKKKTDRGDGSESEPSVMPSMLEALRSLRDGGDRIVEGDLAVHKSGQLALLKERQRKKQQIHERRPSLPLRICGEIDRFWEESKPAAATPAVPGANPRRVSSLPALRAAVHAPSSPSSPTAVRGSTGGDGYAEMLKHLKDLLQRRKLSNAHGGAGPAHEPSPSVDSMDVPDSPGAPPPPLCRTKAQPQASSTDSDAPAQKGHPRGGDSGSPTSTGSAGNDDAVGTPSADDDDEDCDFEDAVPLSPVRHTELNDTYSRMMANMNAAPGGGDSDEGEDEEEGDVEGVYTDDVFLNGGKAEVEEDGEEGYTGYYKLPSPTSLNF